MVSKVISFRVDAEVIRALESRKLESEASVMLTAQRVLSEALGIVPGDRLIKIDEYIESALIPIRERLAALECNPPN